MPWSFGICEPQCPHLQNKLKIILLSRATVGVMKAVIDVECLIQFLRCWRSPHIVGKDDFSYRTEKEG